MFLAVTAASFLALGLALSARIWAAGSMPFAERLFTAMFLGSVTWLGSTWALALLHGLVGPVLILRTIAVAIVGLILLMRGVRPEPLPRRLSIEWVAVLVPIGLWVAFVLWRGAILPPLNHDALAYHLPKAVFYERAGGFDRLLMLIRNIRSLPSNYEMLLADVIATTGSDAVTEWIGTFGYLGFLSAGVALSSRWWATSTAAAMTLILTAGVPVALLHSGAHKNDLMVAFFMVASLVWFVRYLQSHGTPDLVCFIVATAAAVGTKPQAVILGAICALFATPTLLRQRPRPRLIVALIALSIGAAVLFGGATYATNYFADGSTFSVGSRASRPIVLYGDWANLWKGIWVLLAAPFSTDPRSIFVPGESGRWFWRRYELFFSHLGIPFAVSALMLVPSLVMLVRSRRAPRGLLLSVAATLLALFALLPVISVPSGMYLISVPRYVLFLVPVVFCSTISGLVSQYELDRRIWTARILLAVAITFFGAYALDNARNDTFAPFEYVKWATHHPGTRVIPFDQKRAASLIDRRAEADDAVSLDAAFATWIHPAFGAGLTRRVDLILPDAPIVIADDVRWVGIDRAYQVVWGNANFVSLADSKRFLMRGQLQPEDRRVFDAMTRDRRFSLVFYNPRTMQAVFERNGPASSHDGSH